jgi:lipopolysaccharide/colanic/teichoic acid biosynthesis glycosyltransferase
MKREMQLNLKRIADVVLGFVGLVICFPIIALAVAAIRLDSEGPVFFRLRAAGLGYKPFSQWKLRTMVNRAREKGDYFETSSSDPRITGVGRFLRRWSIDELPQLWNVVRGEMSLVGPRPMIYELAAKFSPQPSRRFAMRPGLTGLAQVQGRNSLPWAERIQFDISYVENYSLWMDFRIIVRTIPVVLQCNGIYGKDGRVRIPDLGVAGDGER